VLTLQGSIYTAWNFNRSPLGNSRYVITGADWTKTLAAKAKTQSVGCCANF